MTIKYEKEELLTIPTFRDLIKRTTLNRDVTDDDKLLNERDNSDFFYTAWDGDEVVGYVRGLTDYADVLYVADLGVDKAYWHQGIGRELMAMVDAGIGQHLHQVLLASEYAADYYAKLGFTKVPRGYIKQPQP
jgi:N-acetylglutamate synthase-like GNAT family acetyltransferase